MRTAVGYYFVFEDLREIALGEKGAERLLGRGHLLAKLEGDRDFRFDRVPLVDPEIAEAMVAAMHRRREGGHVVGGFASTAAFG